MALTEYERIIQGKTESSSSSSPKAPKPTDSGKIVDLRDDSFKGADSELDFPKDSSLKQLDDQARGTALNARDNSDIKSHDHNGENSQQISVFSLIDVIGTVTSVPTYKPTRFSEQIILYVNGGTKRLYIYDTSTKAWMYTALT